MKRRILILYGSETGQAEAISQLIYDHCLTNLEVLFDEFGIEVNRFCLDDSDNQFTLEKEETAIFVVSTTGEGDPPQNALKFYRRFRKRTLDKSLLSNLWYTLLALGDTNYERFANFGKQLDKRLQELSAKQFYRTGYADDAVGLEIEVEPWIQNLLPAILNHFNVFTTLNVPIIDSKEVKPICSEMCSKDKFPIMKSNESLSQLSQLTLPLISSKFQSFKINIHETLPEEYKEMSENEFFFKSLPVMDSKIMESALIDVKLLSEKSLPKDMSHSTDLKTIIEATFKVEDKNGLNYEAGDSFGFIIGNPDEEVEELLKILNLVEKRDFYCEVVSPELFPHLPRISKIRDLLKYYLEIRSVPKKSCLRHLSDFCTEPYHKRRLLELSCREGDEDYKTLVLKDFVNILDILQIFHSCRPPLEALLVNCPPFVPRYYSVANSQKTNQNQFRIVFSLVNFEAKNLRKGTQLMGVFTGTLFKLLEEMSTEDNVINRLSKLSLESNIKSFKVFKRKNLFFKLPDEWNTPIIMVGPGTGVAPFIGFLEQRQQMIREGKELTAESWLFYGCRHSNLDFIYKNELNRFLSDKVLTRLCVCFSRETQSKHKYVQQLILKESEAVYKLIDSQKAVVYVCGDIKSMSSEVFNAFVKVVEQSGHQSRENAVKYMREMQTNKRYILDIWS